MTTTNENGVVVGKIEVSGVTFEVRCTRWFNFAVDFEGRQESAPTVDALKAKLSVLLRKTKVEHAIPVVIEVGAGPFGTPGRVERATLRGTNRRTGEFLLTLADGTKVSDRSPSILATGDKLTDEQIAQVNAAKALTAKAAAAEAALRKHLTGHDSRVYSESPSKLIAEAEHALGLPAEV